jgi:hypothetical protein
MPAEHLSVTIFLVNSEQFRPVPFNTVVSKHMSLVAQSNASSGSLGTW